MQLAEITRLVDYKESLMQQCVCSLDRTMYLHYNWQAMTY